jgi:O-antigen ligase
MMRNLLTAPLATQTRWLYAILAILAAVAGLLVALLPEEFVLLIAVLLVGLPFASLVISRSTRHTAIILLLVFVPLTGILKAVTGSRFAPLTFDLGILLVCALHFLEGLGRRRLAASGLDLLFAAFLLLAFVQMFNPNVPSLQAGVEGFRKFAFMSIAFYIGRHMIRPGDLSRIRQLMLIISVPIALYGIKQFFFLSAVDLRMVELATASRTTYFMGGWVRPFSTMPGPFHLGLYLVIVLLALAVHLMHGRPKSSTRLLLSAVLLLHLVVLVMTRTKGNWVGLVAGLVLLALLQARNPIKAVFRLIALSVVGGAAVAVILPLTSEAARQTMQDALFAVTHPLQAPTFIFRLEVWSETVIPALLAHPFLGYGTSSAGEGLRNLYFGTSSTYFASHNLFLKVLLELGLFGLLLFLLIIGFSLKQGWQAVWRTRLPPASAQLLMWSLVVVASFLVSGLVIPTLDAYPANYYFWLLLGVLSRPSRLTMPPLPPTDKP